MSVGVGVSLGVAVMVTDTGSISNEKALTNVFSTTSTSGVITDSFASIVYTVDFMDNDTLKPGIQELVNKYARSPRPKRLLFGNR